METSSMLLHVSEMSSTKQKTCLCLAVGEVVKQGYLFVKRPPRRYWDKLKAWHKRFFVLKDEPDGSLLEMFDTQTSSITKTIVKPQLSLDLNQVVHIGIIEDSSRFPITIALVVHNKTPLVLAAEDELDGKSWMLALGLVSHKGSSVDPLRTPVLHKRTKESLKCSPKRKPCGMEQHRQESSSTDTSGDADSSIFSDFADIGIDTSFLREKFPVTVFPTESSERNGLRGDVELAIFSHGVGVVKPGESDCFLVWPIAFVRCYRHETLKSSRRSRNTLVTIEVGRLCSTGEGVFQFKTQHGDEIVRELKRIISMWSAKRQASSSSRHTRSDRRHGSQRTFWNRAGHSEPSTPLMSFTQSCRKRQGSPVSCGQVKSHEIEESEINYIVPNFDEYPDSKEEVTIGSREITSQSTLISMQTSWKGTDSSDSERSSEQAAYIEVLPT